MNRIKHEIAAGLKKPMRPGGHRHHTVAKLPILGRAGVVAEAFRR